jgi:hypothetical protein
MASDAFREWCWGQGAAEVFGVARADSVWRAIARHGAEYPGKLEVVEVGRRKMVRREQLEAFTRWFAAGPGTLDKRIKIGAVADEPPVKTAARPVDLAQRRAIAELTL